MDKSSEYMDMCARAAPLQRAWVKTRGDVYTTDLKTTCCWLPERPAVEECRGDYGIRRCGEDLVHIVRMIWLPRLDQLMDLAQRPPLAFDRISQAFFNWCDIPRPPWKAPKHRFQSLEQMWLAFVMLSKHGMQWEDAEGWRELRGKTGENA